MTKTLNQNIFFPAPKSEYFFSNIGNQNIFLEKKTITPPPPPFQVKWSFPKQAKKTKCMEKLQALPKGMQKTSQESRMSLHQRYNNGGTREQQSEAVLEIY